MTSTDQATFARTATALVARNDRRSWLRGLRRSIRRRVEVAGIGWSAPVIAAFVLWLLPVNMRVA